ncbi:dihydropteroate synthase [Alkalinema sp. FACHB-956]|uniref:dihydropteroate synthase n=1 Tax=Alkalinema sp. FACHB-956 TaxID=2692768 RepID=UPI0016830E39|nr:dihydropteroate synthase [Alkalinema sp. FACHB-956]
MQATSSMQAWHLRDRPFHWGERTYLMGVLNVTPDSFSDGGKFTTVNAAITQARQMRDHGVDILDIGGQSTRPNAADVSLAEELDRVLPVVQALRADRQFDRIPISIDTTKAAVARAAIAAGADIINDISGATFDDQMLSTVAVLQVPLILMHLRGTPQTMQQLTDYENLLVEIMEFLQGRITAAIAAGISRDLICIDPGIGFAKTAEQNIELLQRMQGFKTLGCPILIGTSRKSFIGKILDQPDPAKRVWGTAATCCMAIAQGGDILRVHDVAEMYDVVRVADALWRN